jgi:molybdopterin biosynthesis enzyme
MVLEIPQRITRLTPLAEALSQIDAQVVPVPPRAIDVTHARGRTLAEDAIVDRALPVKSLALRDGWAVRSELTRDASAYAPALLTETCTRVDAGETLPDRADAVAPFEAVAIRDGAAEIVASVAPGEGVLACGADAAARQALRRAGDKLRISDIAVLAALGVDRVKIREPRVCVVHAGARSTMVGCAIALIAETARKSGVVTVADERMAERDALEVALGHDDADAVIAVGGTGRGRDDASVTTLARVGQLAFHGVGLMPGETTAFGVVGNKPVLLLPGRLDAALAGWLVLGRRLLARLGGGADADLPLTATLSRKIASTVGIAEVVTVRRIGAEVEPLAAGVLPLQALARADGWILVPAECEGYPAGATVAVRPLP